MRRDTVERWVDRLADRAARHLGLDGPPAAASAPAVAPAAAPPVPAAAPRPAAAALPAAAAGYGGQGAELARVLAEFGVDAAVVGSVTGPTVTTWKVRPGPGVKVEKLAGLSSNFAMELGTEHVRMVPVLPGEPGLMAVEVPAAVRQTVWLPAVLAPITDPHPLLVVPGVDTYGRPVLGNLGRMPHLLIAGATGAGKTACINSLLCTLLSRATPQQVRLLLIDPKRVELIAYAGVPHLIMPTVTSAAAAVVALQWLTAEMDDRYQQLADAGVSHVDDYNAGVAAGTIRGEHLPYLVAVVDELADLMMVAKDEVEGDVVRISQLARAAGIHLILATQRPSVDVVTGLIKANMPTRLAFATTSGTDSRVILDSNGAERLIGAGDSLYLGPGQVGTRRLQGPLVSTQQIRQVVAAARTLSPGPAPSRPAPGPGDGRDDEQLLQQATDLVRQAGQASIRMLRRQLELGHKRASELMDLLEQRGVVGPADGTNPRQVLPTE